MYNTQYSYIQHYEADSHCFSTELPVSQLKIKKGSQMSLSPSKVTGPNDSAAIINKGETFLLPLN